FANGAGATAVIYTAVPFGDAAMLVLGFPLGFFASGVFSDMGPFFTEHFPTRVRGVGQGFAYNVGRATGALFPTLVGVLSAQMPLGHAIGLFAATAITAYAAPANNPIAWPRGIFAERTPTSVGKSAPARRTR